MIVHFHRIFLLVVVIFFGLQVHAGPRVGGNGGEPLEIKFKEISLNIYQWIENGNADNIKLPDGITLDRYKSSMMSVLKQYNIEFVNESIVVSGSEKTCVNFRMDGVNQIRCNIARFQRVVETNPDDLYRLVHHEFAGLAGLETSTGAESNYEISQQLSEFLASEVVRRLPVKPPDRREFVCFAKVRGQNSEESIIYFKKRFLGFRTYIQEGVLANLYIYATPNEQSTGFSFQVLKAPYLFNPKDTIPIDKDDLVDLESVFSSKVVCQEFGDGTIVGNASFTYALDAKFLPPSGDTFRITVQCVK